MFSQELKDPVITSITAALLPVSIQGDTHVPKRDGQRPASVLMPLVRREIGWQVLLTKRPLHLQNHPGQVAFPGGRTETGESPCEGALRETCEEVGIVSDDIHLLGRLPSFNAVSEYRVTPYVGLFSPHAKIVADPGEVEEVFEVPLDFFMDETNHVRREIKINGEHHIIYDMPWPNQDNMVHHIWGMTAMMMYRLYQRLER